LCGTLATDLRPWYPDAIAKYRVLIYSGDFDSGVPYSGSEKVGLHDP
jgi:hypothetical protein